MRYMRVSSVKQRISGGMILAIAVITLMAFGCQDDPAFAAEEEEKKATPTYEISLITWYDEVPPFKNVFVFVWKSACIRFKENTQVKLDHYSDDPLFGSILGDCQRILQ